MNLVQLNLNTLAQVSKLVEHPSLALPEVLKRLAPDGHWELLTQKVGSNAAKDGEIELTLPLLDRAVAQDGALSAEWTWSASAEFSAALTMDLLNSGDLTHLAIRPDQGHTMVVYGAKIAAGGQAGAATDKLPWGGFGVNAQGKRSVDVRWYVQAKDDATLLAALQVAQPHFVWPNDLQGMLRMAQRTDWFGLEFELDGEAKLAIDVNAAKAGTGLAVSYQGNSASVGLSLGLHAVFSLSRASQWKVSVMVEPRTQGTGGAVLGLRIKLLDLRQSSRAESLKISASADISGLTASAEKILRANWPDLQNNALLDSLTQPGTAIFKALRELVETSLTGPLLQIATLLLGGTPTDAVRTALVDKLSAGLADTLDDIKGRLDDGGNEIVARATTWLVRLVGEAGINTDAGETAKTLVAKAVKAADSNFRNALEQLENKIVGKPEAEVHVILQGLGELGAQFATGLDQLSKGDASQAIREALRKYSGAREKLLAALTDSHRQKLELALSSSTTSGSSSEAAFDAWFRPDDTVSAAGEQLFYALRSGRLGALGELVHAAQSTGAIADARGWLLSTGKKLSEQRFTLNVFGVVFSNTTTWLREVSVKADLVTGNLMALSASAGVTTAIANPWKNRSTRLGILLDLIPNAVGQARLAVSLDGAFTARQEKATKNKVQDLLNSYADATGARRTDIALLLDLPSASDADGLRRFWNSLTIAIPITLDAQQWSTFASRSPAEIESVSFDLALRQFIRRYTSDSLFSTRPLDDLEGYAGEAGAETVLAYLKRFPAHYVAKSNAAQQARQLGIDANDSGNFDRGTRIFLAVHRLAATMRAPIQLHALVAEASDQLQTLPTHPDPAAVRKALEPVLARIQTCLEPVALVSETWLGIGLLGAEDENLTWPFTSFILTMAKLAGLSIPPAYVPVAQVGDRPGVALISPT